MSRLRAPIRELLEDRLPEAEIQRLWRGVQQHSTRRGSRARVQPLMAATAVLMLGLAGWLSLRPSRAPGPIAVEGAAALRPNQVLRGDAATAWRLSDGSRIQLADASRLQVVENDGRAFTLRLDTGRGEFDVKPGGPQRWRIESGDVGVEVAGTSFAVERDSRGVSVEVRRGLVSVRSARSGSGARQLAAGERLFMPSPAAVPPSAATSESVPSPP
jgi:ferric-dicitrate binding protein FerR (iron transport regulator)